MKQLILVLSVVLPTIFGQGMEDMSCNFTRECQQYEFCQNIADASCVCRFGECVISGGFWFRVEPQCKTFEDCECREDKERCFCRNRLCSPTRWECHETSDCSKLEKCADGKCSCEGNLCEWECDTVGDCADSYCSRALGYECVCKNHQCDFKKKTECETMSDCIDKGLCSRDKPCQCMNDVCTKPWYVTGSNNRANCRSDRDCEETIANCAGGQCVCSNMKNINSYGDRRGTCSASTSRVNFSGRRGRRFQRLSPSRG